MESTQSRPAVNTPEWPRKQPFRPSILVMKGGGVKGIAYVGALQVLEDYGYEFQHYVGTSAGAISAALLAVGYSPQALGNVLATTNFKQFRDGYFLPSLLMLPFRKGLYTGENFRVWLENLLRKKFPEFSESIEIGFRHLRRLDQKSQRLTIFASTKGKTAYPFDSNSPAHYETPISFACRCSMAIPYFFRPERLSGKWMVDGGTQNNYPIYALLRSDPKLRESADFIGLYLGHKSAERNREWLLLDLFSIWSEAGDEAAKDEFIDRTIIIDPRPIKTTDFSLSATDVNFLIAEGRASALHWLYHWADLKRPTLKELTDAEKLSTELRTQVIAEHWRRFWPKVIGVVIFVVLLSTVFYIGFHDKRDQRDNLNGSENKDITKQINAGEHKIPVQINASDQGPFPEEFYTKDVAIEKEFPRGTTHQRYALSWGNFPEEDSPTPFLLILTVGEPYIIEARAFKKNLNNQLEPLTVDSMSKDKPVTIHIPSCKAKEGVYVSVYVRSATQEMDEKKALDILWVPKQEGEP